MQAQRVERVSSLLGVVWRDERAVWAPVSSCLKLFSFQLSLDGGLRFK